MSNVDINVDRQTDGRTENRTPISHLATSRCDKNPHPLPLSQHFLACKMVSFDTKYKLIEPIKLEQVPRGSRIPPASAIS